MFDLKTFLAYIIIIIIASICMKYDKQLNIFNRYRINISIAISFLLLFTLSSLRYKVGTDYESYESLFYYFNEKYPSFKNIFSYRYYFSEIEPGYIFICILSGILTNSPILHFAVITFITLYFTYKAIFYFVDKKYWSIALFSYLCLYYLPGFSGIRTYAAVAIGMYAYRYVYEKKLIKYSLFVLLACSMHISAIVLLPLYLLGCRQKESKVVQYILILICIPLIGVFLSLIPYLSELFDLTRYSEYFNLQFSYKPYGLLLRLPILCMCIMSYLNKNSNHRIKSFFLRLLFWELIISQVCYILPAAGKFVLYLSATQILIVPYLIKDLKYVLYSKFSEHLIILYYMSYYIIMHGFLLRLDDSVMKYRFLWER